MANSMEVTDGTPVLDPTAKVGFGLGMAAFVMAFVPWVTFATWLVAIPAIVLSVIGMVKSSARAQPIFGLVFAILGWGVSLFAIVITAAWLGPESNNDFAGGSNSSQVAEDNTVAEDQFGDESLGQQNARERAANYLESMPFSRSGLIDQLEFNGFTPEEAAYGVDAITVDWLDQAALKAESYLESMPFSRSGLIDQLEFNGFTSEEAAYGATQVGF